MEGDSGAPYIIKEGEEYRWIAVSSRAYPVGVLFTQEVIDAVTKILRTNEQAEGWRVVSRDKTLQQAVAEYLESLTKLKTYIDRGQNQWINRFSSFLFCSEAMAATNEERGKIQDHITTPGVENKGRPQNSDKEQVVISPEEKFTSIKEALKAISGPRSLQAIRFLEENLPKLNVDDPRREAAVEMLITYIAEEQAIKAQIERLRKELSLEYEAEAIKAAKKRNYQKAFGFFDVALQLDPKNKFVYYHRGEVLCSLGWFREGLRDHLKVIEIDSKDPEAYRHIAQTYEAMREYEKAIFYLKKMVELLNSEENFDYNLYLYTEYYRGEYPFVNWSDPIERLQFIETWRTSLADLYALKGDYKEAIEEYNKILSRWPDCFGAFNGRAIVYFKIGEYEKGLRDYEKLKEKRLEVFPNLEELVNKYLKEKNWYRLEEKLMKIIEEQRKFIQSLIQALKDKVDVVVVDDLQRWFEVCQEKGVKSQAAFYDNRDNKIYTYVGYTQAVVLAHEAVHSLQAKYLEGDVTVENNPIIEIFNKIHNLVYYTKDSDLIAGLEDIMHYLYYDHNNPLKDIWYAYRQDHLTYEQATESLLGLFGGKIEEESIKRILMTCEEEKINQMLEGNLRLYTSAIDEFFAYVYSSAVNCDVPFVNRLSEEEAQKLTQSGHIYPS